MKRAKATIPEPDPELLAELSRAGEIAAASTKRAAADVAYRDELIKRVIREGWTHAQIAEPARVTRGRVNQIVHKEES